MKKIVVITGLLILIYNLIAYNIVTFERADLEEKVSMLLNEYRYEESWAYRLNYAQSVDILQLEEENTFEVLISFFQQVEMYPPSTRYDFNILEDILVFKLWDDWTTEQRLEIEKIYREKIYNYLEKYKRIDEQSLFSYTWLHRLETRNFDPITENDAKTMFENLTKEGMTDIQYLEQEKPIN